MYGGDPDWTEIAALEATLLREAAATDLSAATSAELALVLQQQIDDELDAVARMEILALRLGQTSGVMDGVQRARRGLFLLIELHKRLTIPPATASSCG